MVRVRPFVPLTAREEAVVRRLAEGFEYPAIARDLRISPRTVGQHVYNAAQKIPGDLRPIERLVVWWRGAGPDILTGRAT